MVFRVLLPSGRVKRFRGKWDREGSPLGWRVLVPAKEGGITGVVVGVEGDSEAEGEIISFPDRLPLIGQTQLSLLEELASDYLLPRGVLLFKLIPSAFLWREEELVVVASKDVPGLDRLSREVFEYVKKRRGVKLESLKRRYDPKLLRILISKGILKRERRWIHPQVEEVFYRLKVPLKEIIPKLRSSEKKRLAVFLSGRGWTSEGEILSWGFKKSLIRDLVKRGFLEKTHEYVRSGEAPHDKAEILKRLGAEKILIWDRLRKVLELTLPDILSSLEEGRSALILTAETSLIGLVREFFQERLDDRIR